MKRWIIFLFCLLVLNCGDKKHSRLPFGSWNYKLVMNGSLIGKAVISNELNGNIYISKLYMEMTAAGVHNTTEQTIKETTEFKPVSLSVVNTISGNNMNETIRTEAKFKNGTVVLNQRGVIKKFKIADEFVLDGNYFHAELLKNGMKPGTQVSANVYDPSLSPDETVPVAIRVMPTVKIIINEKEIECIHLKQIIADFKAVDYYLNQKGVLEKIEILMLNNRIELIKI